jgi:hypothetical protein
MYAVGGKAQEECLVVQVRMIYVVAGGLSTPQGPFTKYVLTNYVLTNTYQTSTY